MNPLLHRKNKQLRSLLQKDFIKQVSQSEIAETVENQMCMFFEMPVHKGCLGMSNSQRAALEIPGVFIICMTCLVINQDGHSYFLWWKLCVWTFKALPKSWNSILEKISILDPISLQCKVRIGAIRMWRFRWHITCTRSFSTGRQSKRVFWWNDFLLRKGLLISSLFHKYKHQFLSIHTKKWNQWN